MRSVYDGFTTLALGMDAQSAPFLLPEAQCSRAVNVSFRGGLARTRPGYVQEFVNLPKGGEFQGAAVWNLQQGDVIIFVQSGVIYGLKLRTMKLLNFGNFTVSGTLCNFAQAERYFIVMDGERLPAVLEERKGVIRRRPVSSKDVDNTIDPVKAYQSIPRASKGIFAHGRLHLVPYKIPTTEESGSGNILSGDVMEPLRPYTVLRFTEAEYLSEGGAHALPFAMGNIGAVGAFRNAASGTGYGHVLCLAEGGVCAFDFSISRDLWKEQPLSQVLFFGCGCESPWSLVNLNDDVIYRSQDGIRALRYTHAQAASGSGSLSNVPISTVVKPYTELDTGRHLRQLSAAACDNRLYSTCAHVAKGVETHFRGLLPYDVASAEYSGTQGRGAFEGVWTGLDVAQVLTARRGGVGEPTLYALTTDMALFRLDNKALLDKVPAPAGYEVELYEQESPIVSRLETRTFAFGDLGTTKQFRWMELWVKDVSRTTTVRAWYRPSGYTLWTPMGDPREIRLEKGSRPHTRRRLRIPVEEVDCACDPASGQPLWVGTGFQFAIEWEGNMVLERCQLKAHAVAEAPPPPCDEPPRLIESGECSGIDLDDFDYHTNFVFNHDDGENRKWWEIDEDDEEDPDPDPDPEEPGFPEVDPIPDPPLPPYNPPGGGDDGEGGGGYVPPPRPGGGEDPDPDDPEDPDDPGDPKPPSIVTISGPSLITTTSARIRGLVQQLKEAYSPVLPGFRYRKQVGGTWDTVELPAIAWDAASKDFETTLTGLEPGTSYEYQAVGVAQGYSEPLMGQIRGFVTKAEAPEDPLAVRTIEADFVGDTHARLKGTLVHFGAEEFDSLLLYFEYKKAEDLLTGPYHTTPPYTPDGLQSFMEIVEGLEPGTEYVFRAVAEWPGGEGAPVAYGRLLDFTTEEDPVTVVTLNALPSEFFDSENPSYDLYGGLSNMGGMAEVLVGVEVRELGAEEFWILSWGDPDDGYGERYDVGLGEAPEVLRYANFEFPESDKHYEFRFTARWYEGRAWQRAEGHWEPITPTIVTTGEASFDPAQFSFRLEGSLEAFGGVGEGTPFVRYRQEGTSDWEYAWAEGVSACDEELAMPHEFAVDALMDEVEGVVLEYQAGIRLDEASPAYNLYGAVEYVSYDIAVVIEDVAATGDGSFTVVGRVVELGDTSAVARFVEFRQSVQGEWENFLVSGGATGPGRFEAHIVVEDMGQYQVRVGLADASGVQALAYSEPRWVYVYEVPTGWLTFPYLSYDSFDYWRRWFSSASYDGPFGRTVEQGDGYGGPVPPGDPMFERLSLHALRRLVGGPALSGGEFATSSRAVWAQATHREGTHTGWRYQNAYFGASGFIFKVRSGYEGRHLHALRFRISEAQVSPNTGAPYLFLGSLPEFPGPSSPAPTLRELIQRSKFRWALSQATPLREVSCSMLLQGGIYLVACIPSGEVPIITGIQFRETGASIESLEFYVG